MANSKITVEVVPIFGSKSRPPERVSIEDIKRETGLYCSYFPKSGDTFVFLYEVRLFRQPIKVDSNKYVNLLVCYRKKENGDYSTYLNLNVLEMTSGGIPIYPDLNDSNRSIQEVIRTLFDYGSVRFYGKAVPDAAPNIELPFCIPVDEYITDPKSSAVVYQALKPYCSFEKARINLIALGEKIDCKYDPSTVFATIKKLMSILKFIHTWNNNVDDCKKNYSFHFGREYLFKGRSVRLRYEPNTFSYYFDYGWLEESDIVGKTAEQFTIMVLRGLLNEYLKHVPENRAELILNYVRGIARSRY